MWEGAGHPDNSGRHKRERKLVNAIAHNRKPGAARRGAAIAHRKKRRAFRRAARGWIAVMR